MRALVVFESMFGNTQSVAEAIANGLSEIEDVAVETVEVGSAPAVIAEDIDLLVVGGPTHAFGMSRPKTREDAATKRPSGVISEKTGIREWLSTLHRAAPGQTAATFDTRIHMPLLPGSAARAAAKQLRHLDFQPTDAAMTFWVEGTEGPLADGELDRAHRWGVQLGSAART